jgi:outer membrane protein assembly factor BamE (lipoprotein component of BamABCDE complex)
MRWSKLVTKQASAQIDFTRPTFARRLRSMGGAALIALSLMGCAGDQGVGQRGILIDDKALEQIKVGSAAEQVILVLGTPSTTSTVGGKAYYYISQKVSQPVLFMNETITDQRVLAIYIDGKNRVERIANYGMQDGKVFDFISRTTPTGGGDSSLLGSLFRRLGAPAA